MKLRNFINSLQLILAAAVLVSCFREPGTACDKERISLEFSCNPGYSIETKSILSAPGIETKLSSVVVAAYFSKSGKLDKTFVCGSSDRLSLVKDTPYNLYFLANLENPSALRIPEDEKDMERWEYRIPSYESINTNGIPSCAKLDARSFSADSDLDIELERLLCKINVHISHKGITGKQQNDPALFRNVELHIRNANGLLRPFDGGGSRAAGTTDILSVSDYDPDMSAGVSDFVFYVPENMQGQLLPNNSDPHKKTEQSLLSAGENPSLATYVEFTAMLEPSAGGIGGSLLYRMYLGRDNVSDFSLKRNEVYNLDVELVPDNLLHPDWKVSHGNDWTDTRVLSLLNSVGEVIPDGSAIALRPNHPAVVRLFMNTDGGEQNMFQKAVNCGYLTEEIEDSFVRLNWASNVVSSDRDFLSLPELLKNDGISISMNSATGELCFSIDSGADIEAGKEYELEFFLSPGRASHTKKLKLTVLPECTLETDSCRLYVAQKRKLNVLNALGTYSVEIISGAECLDIDENDPSVIYGKKEGQAVVSLKSSRPSDDPQIDVSLNVGKIYIYSSWISGAPTTACIDGAPLDLDITIMDDETGEELDKCDFDPQRLEMYFPATVSWSPYGDFSPEVFLDMNPYTMQLCVKKIFNGEKFILDYANPGNNYVGSFYIRYKGMPAKEQFDVYLLSPFQSLGEVPAFNLTSLSDNSSGNSIDTRIRLISLPNNTRFEYSGKMKPVIELGERNPRIEESAFHIFFPREEQEKYLGEDIGSQYVRAIVANAFSGEEISYDYYVTIVGHFGVGLVFEPVGNDILDAVVRLCWKDCWRSAVTSQGGRGPLSDTNSAGTLDNLFNMRESWKSSWLGGAAHTVRELWPTMKSRTYENMTLQDCIDFMSAYKLEISANESYLIQPYNNDPWKFRNNSNMYIDRNKDSNGKCRWLGCFVPDSEGGRWVDYSQ